MDRRAGGLPSRAARIAGAVQDARSSVVDGHRRHRRGDGARERRRVEVDDAAGRAAAAADVPPEAVATDAVRGDDADARDRDARDGRCPDIAPIIPTLVAATRPTHVQRAPGRRAVFAWAGRGRSPASLAVLSLLLSDPIRQNRRRRPASPRRSRSTSACSPSSRCITACSPGRRSKRRVAGPWLPVAARAVALHLDRQRAVPGGLRRVAATSPDELYHLTGVDRAAPAYVGSGDRYLLTARSSARLDVLDLAGVRAGLLPGV